MVELPATPAAGSSLRHAVATSFVRGEPAGASAEMSIAGNVLLAAGRIALALRAGHGAVFVRADLPAELAEARAAVETALTGAGLAPLERDTALAAPLARRDAAVDSGRWDLWGTGLAEVFAALAAADPTVRPDGGPGGPADHASLPEAAGPASSHGLATSADRGGAEAGTASAEVPDQAAGLRRLFGRRGVRVGAAVAALALAGAGAGLGYALDRSAHPAARRVSTPATTAHLVAYRDPHGRFTLSYPASWTPAQSSDPNVALLLVDPPAGSMLVRVVGLHKAIDPANISAVKAVTDAIVQTASVHMLEQGPVTVGSTRGYFYLYTFTDPSSHQAGVHSHFFLFQGTTMYTLVFQALPATDFTSLARSFDQILQSFRPL